MTDDIKRAVWDAETNGLLDTVTKVHCIVIRNLHTGAVTRWSDEPAERRAGTVLQGLTELFRLHNEEGYWIGGHNTIRYDHAVVDKLYPGLFTYDKRRTFDTMVLARLIWSHIKEIDGGLMKKGKLPGALFGRHSLEAWGVRLGLLKGDFGKKEQVDDTDVWAVFTQEMLDYCDRDTEVTARLLERCLAKGYSQQAIDLEHSIQWVCAQMERNGFHFNEQAAAELLCKLIVHRDRLEAQLKDTFQPWQVRLPDLIPKRDNKSKGYVTGVPVPKFKTVMFNPRSRDHISNRLIAMYGWVPEEFTEGGKPKVDEDVMKDLPYPEAPLLTEYLMVSKRLGQLSEGDNAWLKLVNSEGRIHGSINPNGAVTGRATHMRPNISQTPNGSAAYGHECRHLFGVPPGWILVGADASGLELRCLAHYMARWDGGAYGNALLNGDIHWVNTLALGRFPAGTLRDKTDQKHEDARNQSKTFIYGFLYGAGDAKIGLIVGGTAADGRKLKLRFLKGLPALKYLKDAVGNKAKTEGALRGLDGRIVHIRSAHSSLNTLLQSAGALVCKLWVTLVEDELQARGLKHGWDGDYALCAWSHDEVQIACRTQEIADVVKAVAVAMVTRAGEIFQFRCRLDGESKQGTTWAETH
jgi:DNA polymerase-1